MKPSGSQRHVDLVDLGEMVREHLLDATLLLRLLLERIQVLEDPSILLAEGVHSSCGTSLQPSVTPLLIAGHRARSPAVSPLAIEPLETCW